MSKFMLTQRWNTTKGWTVAERILLPKSFNYTADAESADGIFAKILCSFQLIADRQKNASMLTDGKTYAKMGRNGNLDEIVVKLHPINL